MSKKSSIPSSIQIFARIRPTTNSSPTVRIGGEDGEDKTRLEFTQPKDVSGKGGLINNTREYYDFHFDQVFDQPAKQDQVFNTVAMQAVESVLDGYNSTIFAYGQTGSGKTYTITGGPELYADRGLIPRVLQYMYSEIGKRPGHQYTVSISYLEVYRERCYDLLNAENDINDLDRLAKATIHEDDTGNFYVNIREVQTTNEEDAINLLFEGDMNRMIAATPMNQASSRSHCIFTIRLTCHEAGSDTILKSKLHLVDLAGSERVGKTGAEGTLLSEAVDINLSLHYLEQVIIALQKRETQHIPYRNSVMTQLLKDSLGGNCRTAMIATMSVEPQHLDESISTARFAQRVALIKQNAIVNEEIDPQLVIKRLKDEIKGLKEELALATGDVVTDPLDDIELDKVREAVMTYIDDKSSEATLWFADARKIRHAYSVFRELVGSSISVDNGQIIAPHGSCGGVSEEKVVKIRQQLAQRDAEIRVLVGMLKRKKDGRDIGVQTVSQPMLSYAVPSSVSTAPSTISSVPSTVLSTTVSSNNGGNDAAFQRFKANYEGNNAMDSNKKLLRHKYAEAKQLGESVNQSRTKIGSIKAVIEQLRVESAMRGSEEADPLESEKWKEIEEEKKKYRANFVRLKDLKGEIEHIQHLLEQGRVRLLKDFEEWQSLESQKPPTESRKPPTESRKPPTVRHRSASTEITGDTAVDADIQAFYKARDRVVVSQTPQRKLDPPSLSRPTSAPTP